MKPKSSHVSMAITVLVALFTICYGVYEFRREQQFRSDILDAQLQLNNLQYVTHDSLHLRPETERGDIRVTVIDTAGHVISDTHPDSLPHVTDIRERYDVQQALKTGKGHDIRRSSEELDEEYFYASTYFPDSGIVVRSAVPYSAPLTSTLKKDYTSVLYTISILLLIGFIFYLRQRVQYAEDDKVRLKRTLTENAAHELKTPAAAIEGYLETVLYSHPTEEQQRHFLERCYKQSKRMSRLLKNMSTLTALDDTVFVRPQSNIDAVSIIHDVIRDTETEFADKGIEIIEHLPAQLPLTGDSSIIYSIFRNICDNALAYATGATRLTITGQAVGKTLRFSFADNGPGVDPLHLPHLFERFYRTDKGRTRRHGGTGLGLAIVKNVATQYGGSVSAETTPGGGLTINVTLKA